VRSESSSSGVIAVGVFVAGAVLLAIGIGLVPQLLENTASVPALVGAVALVGGAVFTVAGGWAWLRGRRRPAQAGGTLALLVVAAVVVAVVAPAVAGTNVPPSSITATPADLDLPYESVTVTTSDDVQLAAWYLPGTNGAAVVVLHGAGSTRSNALDQAAVLYRNGYGVLLLDARGHGDSDGTAMDFGWYGDLDVGAAIDHLLTRDDVDPDRIGVLGLSMGGEEAIGAAAAHDAIRAVVAEGATARTAADKTWLSDVYGWRGWLQEQIERAQYGVTDLLTAASPPTSLADAVARAADTPFLLIVAGAVADEQHAADHLDAVAPDRVEVWTVDDAGHTDGLEVAPAPWERRVVGFLDEHLGGGP
jgi:fermentation-respiration switch protein FrsA (DUF1100 family)